MVLAQGRMGGESLENQANEEDGSAREGSQMSPRDGSPASCLTQVFAYISGLLKFSPERGACDVRELARNRTFVVGFPVDPLTVQALNDRKVTPAYGRISMISKSVLMGVVVCCPKQISRVWANGQPMKACV